MPRVSVTVFDPRANVIEGPSSLQEFANTSDPQPGQIVQSNGPENGVQNPNSILSSSSENVCLTGTVVVEPSK